MPDAVRIGVISDTHGRLDPRVREVFADVAVIIHAGDVGSPAVLAELARIAPVTAVRGNTDRDGGVRGLPNRALLTVEGLRLAVSHIEKRSDGRASGADVVITGHTHAPEVRREGTRLFVNPGSASSPRSGSAPSVAVIELDPGGVRARIVSL